jgi:predicted dinucleotide-binding enzyme
VSNPLDFSKGLPPTLLFCNTNSLGEEVQKALPTARVVKTLNTVNCQVMVEPRKSGGEPTMLLCGNDAQAKTQVGVLLKSLGWKDLLDLGDISRSRGTEMLLPLWLSLWQATGTPLVSVKVLRP